MSGVVGDNRENLKESIKNLKAASARLDNTLDAAGKVMAKIDRGEGTLGKLVNDNTAHNSLTDTLEGINRYVRKTEQLQDVRRLPAGVADRPLRVQALREPAAPADGGQVLPDRAWWTTRGGTFRLQHDDGHASTARPPTDRRGEASRTS